MGAAAVEDGFEVVKASFCLESSVVGERVVKVLERSSVSEGVEGLGDCVVVAVAWESAPDLRVSEMDEVACLE